MAAIVGAELARMVYRRHGETWVRLSVWTERNHLRVDLFEKRCQVGRIFEVDELKNAPDKIGAVKRDVEKLVKRLEADIKDRAE